MCVCIYIRTLEYTPKHIARSITWFNPPYNRRDFLDLISKHSPSHGSLAKIFNRNDIKVSYSCTRNIFQIIKSHNRKIEIHHNTTHPNKQCNYWDKESCPQTKPSTKKCRVQGQCKHLQLSQSVHRCNRGKPKTKDMSPQTFPLQKKLLSQYVIIHRLLVSKGHERLTCHH